MKTLLLQQYLNERHKPLASCPAHAPALDQLCREQPAFCAQALTDAATHASQKAQLFAGLLRRRSPARRSLGRLTSCRTLNSCRYWTVCRTAASMAAESGNWGCTPL